MYDIESVNLRVDLSEEMIDNITAIQNSLTLIQDALNDISSRLEALE